MTTLEEQVAHLVSLRHQSFRAWPTRDRILYAASQLIAARGYHGATTREIAERAGIKQPSLFNHFPSKQAILEALLVLDLTIPADKAEQIASDTGSPAVRLYGYIVWDLAWYQQMPFDLRGMNEELVKLPGLDPFRASLERWMRAIKSLLDQGLHSGDFRADAVPLVPAVLETLSWEFVRSRHQESADQSTDLVPVEGAQFVLRGLLVDPRRIEVIGEAAKETMALAM